MRGPVLWHNVARPTAPGTGSLAQARGTSFGRGLYAQKLRGAAPESVTEPTESAPRSALGPRPRTLLRWQEPLSYLVIWQGRGWTVTWHAPWCKRCDCVGAGWRFERAAGYLAGLGFELSRPSARD
jgi:hypothetical protein